MVARRPGRLVSVLARTRATGSRFKRALAAAGQVFRAVGFRFLVLCYVFPAAGSFAAYAPDSTFRMRRF